MRRRVAVAVAAVGLLLAAATGAPSVAAAFSAAVPAAAVFTAAADFGTHAQQVAASGATGYWRLNEAVAGRDSSPSAAAAAMAGVTPQVAGAVGGYALRTTGSGSVAVPASAAYRFAATAAFTVEAWVRPSTVDGTWRMIANCDAGSASNRDGWYLWHQQSDGLGVERWQAHTSSGAAKDTTALAVGSWTYVAATYDGTTLRLYRNGAAVASIASAKVIGAGTCSLHVGDWPPQSANNFAGDLDEVAVYPAALSAARVSAHWAARGSSSGYAAAVAADSPTGYWRFEGTLTAADASPSAAHGTYAGPVVDQVAGGLSGSADPAARFDGDSAGVAVPSSTRYAFSGTAPFSVEAWVRPTTVDAQYRMIATCAGSASPRDGWYLWQHGSWGLGSERFSGGTQSAAVDGVPLSVGSWVHVMVTYDGTVLRLYRNGALASWNDSSTFPIGSAPCTLRLGSWGGTPSPQSWAGDLDEVAVYPAALSATRVLLHYWRRR